MGIRGVDWLGAWHLIFDTTGAEGEGWGFLVVVNVQAASSAFVDVFGVAWRSPMVPIVSGLFAYGKPHRTSPRNPYQQEQMTRLGWRHFPCDAYDGVESW